MEVEDGVHSGSFSCGGLSRTAKSICNEAKPMMARTMSNGICFSAEAEADISWLNSWHRCSKSSGLVSRDWIRMLAHRSRTVRACSKVGICDNGGLWL